MAKSERMYGLSPALFVELLDLWQRLQKDFAIAAPFVPVVGTHYGAPDAPKIMYIGKATEGWDEEPRMTLAGRDLFTREFYESLCSGDYRSIYWYFIRNMTEKLYSAVGAESKNDMKWALDRVIWSNLMKIGTAASWPRKSFAKAQAPFMEKLLRYELETHRPDAIILTTNWYEWEFVEKVFGTKGRKELATIGGWTVTAQDVDEFGARLYWTRHPQGWKDRTQAEDAIAEDFVAFFSTSEAKRAI